MKLSIIICTFNRSTELEQLLEDLSAQHRRLRSNEGKEIEVILVDNNSMDSTSEVAYRFVENTSLSIKYFTHDHFGLTPCRNLAISKASGDLLAFIHDDINLDEDWLKEVYKVASNCQDQEVGVYGGRSIPMWQDSLPEWLNLEPPYAVSQEVFTGHTHGDEETYYPFESEFGLAEFPSGVNVLVRKEIFENCGDFRVDLGASAAGGMGLYDDFEFFEYLYCLKIPMLYLPQVIVFHPVSRSQLKIQNVRRWYFKSGRAHYWMAHTDRMKRAPHPLLGIEPKFRKLIPRSALKKINGVPAYLYLKLFSLITWWLVLHLSFDSKRKNYLSYKISEAMGEIDAAAMVNEIEASRKFSFKDRLMRKGIIQSG